MKLLLKDIKTTSPRVRQSQDPEELDVLAASIGALNQAIIPVGVRKNGSGWDLVYGHRRVAAAKQAGLKEIEAIEVEAPDDFLKVYGLVENVVRENMSAMDIAKTLQQIKDESGWSDEKIGKFFGRAKSWVAESLSLLDPEIVKAVGASSRAGTFGTSHLQEVKAGLGEQHRNQMPAVIKKVIDEGLSTRQARHVAEEVAKARTFSGDRGAQAVLRAPYEQIRDTTAALEATEVNRSEASPTRTQDWRALMSTVDGALRTLEMAITRLAASKQGKAIIKSFVPKWIKSLKAILRTLEAAA